MSHRIATAILLTRAGTAGDEVFLALRSKKLRFFGGYWAFPGGVVDAIDVVGDQDGDETHRRCALRELFEEVGVLVGPLAERVRVEARVALRRGLLAEDEDALASWRELIDATPRALAAEPRP
jgi:8-oxo-dGTP pyrophosphatase MutT (NUDIX family)